MKNIRRLLSCVIAALLLTGCAENVQRVPCAVCGDQIDRWISLDNGEPLCAACFEKDGYRTCIECGFPYVPGGNGDADGYCGACAQTETQSCDQCGDQESLADLAHMDDGSYLCASCLYGAVESIGSVRYDDGYSAGYADGKNAGYSEGETAGYNTGYSKGFSEGKASVRTTAAAPSTGSGSTGGSSGGTSAPSASQPQSVTVYITNTGSKYHRSGCQYLKKSCIPISLSDAKSRGYTACSRCW